MTHSPPAAVSATSRSSNLRWGLYLILIVAICLRVYGIASQSFWLDEIWTVEIACGHDADHQLIPVNRVLDHPPDLTSLAGAAPPWRIWTRMDRITGPPLYYLLLRLWMMIFDESESSLRLLSALFSAVTLVVFYFSIRDSAISEPALWAIAICTLAGTQIHYAQEARPYALLIFELVVAIFFSRGISIRGPANGRAFGLYLSLLSLMMTHYFSVAAVLAIGVYGLIYLTGRARKQILISVIAASITFAIVWGPMIYRQIPMFSSNDRAAAFLRDSAPHHFLQTGWRLLTLPMSLLCDIRPIPSWYALGAFWYLLMIWLLIRRKISPLWALLFISVTGLLTVLDLSHGTAHLSFIRYPLIASLPVYVVLSALIRAHRGVGRAVCVTVTGFCLLLLPRAFATTNEDFRSFGQAIAASTQRGDVIVFAGPSQPYSPQILYLAASYYAWPLPGPVVLIESPAKPELIDQLKTRKTIWLAADPTVLLARQWLPGYHLVAGKSWPEVGSLLQMDRDP